MYATLLWASYCFPKIYKSLVVYQFYCMALFLSQTRHMINYVSKFCMDEILDLILFFKVRFGSTLNITDKQNTVAQVVEHLTVNQRLAS